MGKDDTKEVVASKLHPEEILLSWEALEFEDHDRKAIWYIAAGVLALAIFAYCIYTKDWFFAAVVVVLVLVSWKHLRVKPKRSRYGISQVGINVNDRLYPYDELHSFWVVYQPPVKTLNILSTRKYLPQLSIQLEDQDPVILKKILKKFIPEQEKRGEAAMDKLSRVLKF